VAHEKGDTLSLSEPAFEAEVRSAPHLFLELECDRPLAGPARWRLKGLDQVRLGRGASRRSQNDSRVLTIEVPDGWMSVEHLELLHRDGRWIARDLGSKNKLILDGQRVDEAELSDGVLLQLGHTFFRFRADIPAVDPATLDLEHVQGGIGLLSTLSSTFQLVLDRVAAVAPGRVPVLLVGESGTGKEVLARSIHAQSGRKGALIAVNSGAIPPNLVEAELFGHKKGAFTGAGQERVGWVRASDHGTLFLDEIGDLPLTAQASLLRVIQEAEVVPVGGNRPEALDLRVVAATHRDLWALVREGRFRHDLLARLDGITLKLPALRDRAEDIPVLLVLLFRKLAPERPDVRLTPAAAQAILTHDWPLNIRQLEQAVAHALALSGIDPIERAHLPEAVLKGAQPQAVPELDPEESRHRDELIRLLAEHRGNITAVATALGKGRTQVIRWIKRYGIDVRPLRS
jgi:transcriptional regulator of acetoin/glycerol metabolism